MFPRFNAGEKVWVSKIWFSEINNIGNLKIGIKLEEKEIIEVKIQVNFIGYLFGNFSQGTAEVKKEEEVFKTEEEARKVINKNIMQSFINFIE